MGDDITSLTSNTTYQALLGKRTLATQYYAYIISWLHLATIYNTKSNKEKVKVMGMISPNQLFLEYI